MPEKEYPRIEYFQFRGLHPNISIGTASDRYAGWIGQIYSARRYAKDIIHRSKSVGGKVFTEEVLPVESVEEYFRHFGVLEMDFTFYQPLLDKDKRPTRNYHVLSKYSHYLNKEDRLILKVPQIVFARKLRSGGAYVENEQYLSAKVFTTQFYEPGLGLLGPWLEAFIFEQEYQRKSERPSAKVMAAELDGFFGTIPRDKRYHVELRTDSLLAPPVFDVLVKYGVGQVLSHWTWLPPLARQFALSGRRFSNAGNRLVVRLMTPRGMRYEDAYARAHPFTGLVNGMLDPRMVDETADLMWAAVKKGVQANIVINNRSGGNAPVIAQRVAEKFLAMGADS